jgi:4-aminobutyrate aminotransferase
MSRIPNIKVTPPGPNAQEYVELDHKYISTGSGVKLLPVVPEHGEGATITDVDGNVFIDFLSGAGAAITGYSHPVLVKAVQEQVYKIQHSMVGYMYSTNAITLARKISDITPGKYEKKIAYGLSGSDAGDMALKIARYATKKSWIITFIGAYHGQTYGSTSLTQFQGSLKKDVGPLVPNILAVPYPDPYRNPWNIDGYKEPEKLTEASIGYIEKYVIGHVIPKDDIAMILVEPIQGDGGTVIPPQNFFPELRRLCDKYGILLGVDEVQTGIGRTGKWFGIEHFGVEPDLMMLGKGLASGMGLSAVVYRETLQDPPPGSLILTSAATPVTSVAALATIDIIEKEGLLDKSSKIGEYLMKRFHEMQNRYPIIGDVRGRGLMMALDIVKDRTTKLPDPDLTGKICWRAFELGLILPSIGFYGNCIRIVPPLVLSEDLAKTAADIMEQAINDAIGGKVERGTSTWS